MRAAPVSIFCERCGRQITDGVTLGDVGYCVDCSLFTCAECWNPAGVRCAECAPPTGKPGSALHGLGAARKALAALAAAEAGLTRVQPDGAGAAADAEYRLELVRAEWAAAAARRALDGTSPGYRARADEMWAELEERLARLKQSAWAAAWRTTAGEPRLDVASDDSKPSRTRPRRVALVGASVLALAAAVLVVSGLNRAESERFVPNSLPELPAGAVAGGPSSPVSAIPVASTAVPRLATLVDATFDEEIMGSAIGAPWRVSAAGVATVAAVPTAVQRSARLTAAGEMCTVLQPTSAATPLDVQVVIQLETEAAFIVSMEADGAAIGIGASSGGPATFIPPAAGDAAPSQTFEAGRWYVAQIEVDREAGRYDVAVRNLEDAGLVARATGRLEVAGSAPVLCISSSQDSGGDVYIDQVTVSG